MKISLFYNHATVLDYAYLDEHRGVVGNSYIVNAEFIGETDHEGVVYDFSYAKKKVKEIIDRDVDHRLVVPMNILSHHDGLISFEYKYGLEDKILGYQSPEEGVCEIPYNHISRENLSAFIEDLIIKEMPDNIISVRITLEDEKLPTEAVKFHYSHGLKDHYGNCQRLFHGHSNTVEVEINGERRPDFERHLATEVFSKNIHFAFWENVVNKEEIEAALNDHLPNGRYEECPDVHIRYEASQGVFEGRVPGELIYFMQDESTVENLSMEFARYIKSNVSKNDIVKVRAFEGIGKGAITSL